MGNEIVRMLWAQVWQVTLLILIVIAVARFFGANRPHLMHALWMVVLLKALTPPIWSSPGGLFSWLQLTQLSEVSTEDLEPVEPPNNPALPTTLAADNSEDLLNATFDQHPAALISAEDWQYAPKISSEELLLADSLEMVAPITPAIPLHAKAEVPSGDRFWKRLAFGIWFAGTLGSLLLAWARWMACRREILRAGIVDDPLAQELLRTLRTRLGVRRKVRLIISQSRIGPAVLGLFRPIVLIPARIRANKSLADLEPILAHELIHVRRGDLAVGWLQVLVAAVWWFHPLVHLAGRWLKHDAERCCDEEVIAALNCKPARYARVLLDVLELKHVLKPVPVLPGVKPVEITQKRLERIMLLGQGCRKRTPWWCWLTMLATAALTLPGAAFVAEAKDKTKRKDAKEQQRATSNDSTAQMRSYKVGEVLERIKTEFGVDNKDARTVLASHVKLIAGAIWEEGQLLSSPNQAGTPSLRIKGNTLTVHHSPQVQDAIADQLELLRKHGFQQIAIEARIITASRDVVEKAISNWELVAPSEASNDRSERESSENSNASDNEAAGNVARMSVEKSLPMRMAILNDSQMKTLIEYCQSDARSNLMFCPKVTVFNGQSATIQDTTQRPFVVGLSREGQPTIRVVSKGISLKLRPVLNEKQIQLESKITLSDIRGVEVIDLPNQTDEKTPLKVQVPEVATTRINTTVTLPDGGSVLLGGLKLPETKRVPAGRGILQTLGLADTPEPPEQQLFVALRVIHLKEEPAQPLEQSYEATMAKPKEQRRPALLFFRADWCGPCNQMETSVFQTSKFRGLQGISLRRINVDRERELASRYKVQSLPTTILLSPEGKEVQRIVGLTSLNQILSMVGQVDSLPHPPSVLKHQSLPYGLTNISDAQVQNAKAAARLAELELKRALEVNEKLEGTVADLEIRRLKLAAERAHLQVEQAKHELDQLLRQAGFTLQGLGVNSEAGVTGRIILDEKNFDIKRPVIEPPTDAEVLKALDENQKATGPLPVNRGDRKNVTIVKELVSQSRGKTRHFPLVGSARSQVAYFKCTVYFDEVQQSEWPVPFAHSDKTTAVVYIEKPYIVRVDGRPAPAPTADQVRPSAYYLQDDVQYFPAPSPAKSQSGRSDWSELATARSLSKETDVEKAIKQKLSQKVSLNFKETPLNEAMKQIAKITDLNIVIDEKGLAYDGITSDHPITLDVKEVKLNAALNLMLEPLNLCDVIENDVLRITSNAQVESATFTVVTYPVADLVIPVPQRVAMDLREAPGKIGAGLSPKAKGEPFNFEGLVQVIQSTVEPDSWDARGGSGAIKPYEATLSLVVRQSQKVHEQLRDVLTQLRRLQDLQVVLTIRTLDVESVPKEILEKLNPGKPIVLTKEQLKTLEGLAKNTFVAPKVTLFNGQTFNVLYPSENESGYGVDFNPVISADRRFVRLSLRTNTQGKPGAQSQTHVLLKDGQSMVIDAHKVEGKTIVKGTKLSLVSPTIIIQEEEEELLGIPEK